MYTREAFERQRATVKLVGRREARLLAVFAVGLGVGQLVFIRWIETRLDHGRAVPIEGLVFLGYLALVCGLIWRMQRRVQGARLVCPHCGARLGDMSERVAAATGKCDTCGNQVVE